MSIPTSDSIISIISIESVDGSRLSLEDFEVTLASPAASIRSSDFSWDRGIGSPWMYSSTALYFAIECQGARISLTFVLSSVIMMYSWSFHLNEGALSL